MQTKIKRVCTNIVYQRSIVNISALHTSWTNEKWSAFNLSESLKYPLINLCSHFRHRRFVILNRFYGVKERGLKENITYFQHL